MRSLIAAAVSAFACTSASADVVYTYTGNEMAGGPFVGGQPTSSPQPGLTITLDFSDVGQLLSWSMSEPNVGTITQDDPIEDVRAYGPHFTLVTDAVGDVTSWLIYAYTQFPNTDQYNQSELSWSNIGNTALPSLDESVLVGPAGPTDTFQYISYAYVPGTWRFTGGGFDNFRFSTQVPELPSAVLMFAGLLVIGRRLTHYGARQTPLRAS